MYWLPYLRIPNLIENVIVWFDSIGYTIVQISYQAILLGQRVQLTIEKILAAF